MNPPYLFFENLDREIPLISPDSIVSRTLVSTPELKVILFGFAPGQELSEHTSARPALLHFLRGEARVRLGGDPFLAKAGTFVQMPARLAHSIFADTEVVMLLVMVAAPGELAGS
jgi:quercetin dioxygenase-like cupin family protein